MLEKCLALTATPGSTRLYKSQMRPKVEHYCLSGLKLLDPHFSVMTEFRIVDMVLWGEKHRICTLQPFSPDSTLQAHHYSIAITMANVQTFTAKTYHVTSTDMNQNSFRPCYKCKKLLLRKSPTLNCFFVVRDNSEFKTGVGNRKPFHYFKQEFMAIRK